MKVRNLLAYSDFGTVPVAIVGLCAIWPGRDAATAPILAGAVKLAAGAVAWTFTEYLVHRALHSRRFPALRRLHMRHHRDPRAKSDGAPYSTLLILALFVTAILVPSAAPLILGIFIGYLFFILLHFGEHHGWPLVGPLAPLAEAHDLHHHAGPDRMFGVTTQLWDRLFGTA